MFDNDIKDMLDDIEITYQKTLEHNHTHSHYIVHLFDSLLTSKKIAQW